ncbi:type II secretion system protein GspJ [uncultured Tateyamaria sp.]|uniref:type II secretion system protein GspJ n=1 Tax=Tateyamaria sp. 1078 TaxID=3417464 RepID=UPI00262F8BCE|nr:type II secretion system protein GspJ [uncultured Tateyamaria sp.]
MTTRGITLIELVAAMAIFALVAIMGLQSLSGTLRARDALSSAHQDVTALTRPVALLRNDLSALVPLLFHGPGDAPPRSSLWHSRDGTTLALSLAGQVDLDTRGTLRMNTLQRAVWRLDGDTRTLYRGGWRALTPANADAQMPEVAVMSGIAGLRVRSYWPRQGWQPGVSPSDPIEPQGGDSDASTGLVMLKDTLPDAIEVTLILENGGEIPVLETLQ